MPEQSDGHPKNIVNRIFLDNDEQSEVGHPKNIVNRIFLDNDKQSEVGHPGLKKL